NTILVKRHQPRRPDAQESKKPLDSIRKDATACGVEVDAIDVEMPTVDSRDLIETLPQHQFPKQVVAIERRKRNG
ncbi:hypothetical protein, partial [uncultured Mycobacterium sp.]|uniref:hypothetical protein n=1 Tax=uncultured Mycobacterium sp. TaxID=171292 RepID=UPI0035CB9695